MSKKELKAVTSSRIKNNIRILQRDKGNYTVALDEFEYRYGGGIEG
jgi:hypothetical protein